MVGEGRKIREKHLHKWFFTTPGPVGCLTAIHNIIRAFFCESNKFKNLTFIEFFFFFFCALKGAKIDLKERYIQRESTSLMVFFVTNVSCFDCALIPRPPSNRL